MNNNSITINDSFLLKKKISSGTFGIIYNGIDLKTHEEVAVKMNKSSSKVDSEYLLQKESKILSKLKGTPGIPSIKWYGKEGDKSYLVMSLHSNDMAHMFKKLGKFSMKSVVMMGERLVSVLESIHRKGVVHRDLKPENILAGKKDSAREIFLVDFGISRFFKDSLGRHLKYSEGRKFVGTCRYASKAAHKGKEIGRKDDLENLGYVLIFLLKGSLPWQKHAFSPDEKYSKVGSIKESLSFAELCNGLPEQFIQYFEYLKQLDFYDKPDYKYLRSLFYNIGAGERVNFDYKWDWLGNKKNDISNSDTTIYQGERKEFRRSSIECSFKRLSKSRERFSTQGFFHEKVKRISELCHQGSECNSQNLSYIARESDLDEFMDEEATPKVKMQQLVTFSMKASPLSILT